MAAEGMNVVLGAGPVGRALVAELLASGETMRVVSKSGRADLPEVMYWSPWGAFPLACLLPLFVKNMDAQVGPGLPQRLSSLLLVSLPMLNFGAGLAQWLLTLLLCIPLWHIVARMYDRRFV